MNKKNYSVDDVRRAVIENKSMAGVLRTLNLRPVGGNYTTIKRLIKENNIDVTHFTGQGWNVGLKFRPMKHLSDSEVFIKNSNYKCSWRLRERLLKYRTMRKCDKCGYSEWMGEPIPLEVHHINGDNLDNRFENLQVLCPNCHAQTENFRGKGKLSALSEMREVEYRKFREVLTDNADDNPEPSLIYKEGAETRHDTPKV